MGHYAALQQLLPIFFDFESKFVAYYGNQIVVNNASLKSVIINDLLLRQGKCNWSFQSNTIDKLTVSFNSENNIKLQISGIQIQMRLKKELPKPDEIEAIKLIIQNLQYFIGGEIEVENMNVYIFGYGTPLLRFHIPHLRIENKESPQLQAPKENDEIIVQKSFHFDRILVFLNYMNSNEETIEVPIAEAVCLHNQTGAVNFYLSTVVNSFWKIEVDINVDLLRILLDARSMQILLNFYLDYFVHNNEHSSSLNGKNEIIDGEDNLNRQLNIILNLQITKSLLSLSYEEINHPEKVAYYFTENLEDDRIPLLVAPNLSFDLYDIRFSTIDFTKFDISIMKFLLNELKFPGTPYTSIIDIKKNEPNTPDFLLSFSLGFNDIYNHELHFEDVYGQIEVLLYSRLINYIFVLTQFYQKLANKILHRERSTNFQISARSISAEVIYPLEGCMSSSEKFFEPIVGIECVDVNVSTQIIPSNCGQEFEVTFQNFNCYFVDNRKITEKGDHSFPNHQRKVPFLNAILKQNEHTIPIRIQSKLINPFPQSSSCSVQHQPHNAENPLSPTLSSEHQIAQIIHQTMKESTIAVYVILENLWIEVEKFALQHFKNVLSSLPSYLQVLHSKNLEKLLYIYNPDDSNLVLDLNIQMPEYIDGPGNIIMADEELIFEDCHEEFVDCDNNNQKFHSVSNFESSKFESVVSCMVPEDITFGFHVICDAGTCKLSNASTGSGTEIIFQDFELIFGSKLQNFEDSSIISLTMSEIDVLHRTSDNSIYELISKLPNNFKGKKMFSLEITKALSGDISTSVHLNRMQITHSIYSDWYKFYHEFFWNEITTPQLESNQSNPQQNIVNDNHAINTNDNTDINNNDDDNNNNNGNDVNHENVEDNTNFDQTNQIQFYFDNVEFVMSTDTLRFGICIDSGNATNRVYNSNNNTEYTFYIRDIEFYISKLLQNDNDSAEKLEKKVYIGDADTLNLLVSISFLKDEIGLDVEVKDSFDLHFYACSDSLRSFISLVRSFFYTREITRPDYSPIDHNLQFYNENGRDNMNVIDNMTTKYEIVNIEENGDNNNGNLGYRDDSKYEVCSFDDDDDDNRGESFHSSPPVVMLERKKRMVMKEIKVPVEKKIRRKISDDFAGFDEAGSEVVEEIQVEYISEWIEVEEEYDEVRDQPPASHFHNVNNNNNNNNINNNNNNDHHHYHQPQGQRSVVRNNINIIDNYIQKLVNDIEKEKKCLLPNLDIPNLRIYFKNITLKLSIFEGKDWEGTRNEDFKFSLALQNISFQYDTFDLSYCKNDLKNPILTRMGITVTDIEFIDEIKDSERFYILSYDLSDLRSEASNLFTFYTQTSINSEGQFSRKCKIKLLPIRLNLTGNAFDFLIRYYYDVFGEPFEDIPFPAAAETSVQPSLNNNDVFDEMMYNPYFGTPDDLQYGKVNTLASSPETVYENFEIDMICINLSYKPMDNEKLQRLKTAVSQYANFQHSLFSILLEIILAVPVNIDTKIILPPVIIKDQQANLPTLFASIIERWDFASRVPEIIKGIGLFRALSSYCRGVFDLIYLTYSHAHQGRALYGLKRGMSSLTANFAFETLMLVAKTANGTLSIMDNVIGSERRRRYTSRYADQPSSIVEGFNQALVAASEYSASTIDRVIHQPIGHYRRSGTVAYLRSFASGIPTAAISPFLVVTEVVAKLSQGTYNSFNPQHLQLLHQKYKPKLTMPKKLP